MTEEGIASRPAGLNWPGDSTSNLFSATLTKLARLDKLDQPRPPESQRRSLSMASQNTAHDNIGVSTLRLGS